VTKRSLSAVGIITFLFVLAVPIGGCRKDEPGSSESDISSVAKNGEPATDKEEQQHDHEADVAHAHDHHQGDGHTHGEMPKTYSAAIIQIGQELDEIETMLASAKIQEIHEPCHFIVEICASLPKLAADEDSGVAKDAIKTVNLTRKSLASKAEEVHKTGEAGNAEHVRPLNAQMVALYKTLSECVTQAANEHRHDHDHDHGHDHDGETKGEN